MALDKDRFKILAIKADINSIKKKIAQLEMEVEQIKNYKNTG